MTTDASRGRIARLRELMKAQDYQYFYVRNTSNIHWLTTWDGVFDEESAHALLVADDEQVRPLFHTDSRYVTAAQLAAATTGEVVQVDASPRRHEAILAEQLSELSADHASCQLAIENDMQLAEFRRLEQQCGEICPHPAETDRVIFHLRAVKDAEELTRMRAAQAITDAAFAYIITAMRPGMTEREVALQLNDYMLQHGAEGLAFPCIVATGANGASPHAIPGETKLEAGQCVVMDFGARARSYCSDMTRVVFLGEPDARMTEAWAALRDANESVEAFLRPGVTGAQAHQLAEDILAQHGFGGAMGHGLGHGVGLDIHEEPVLNPRNDQPLAPGHVVTVEPGIYLPGQWGMRLEDCGVITADGFEVFTQSTHDMVII